MFKTKKSLGQNFLIDTSIVDRIIKSVDVKDNEKILEVGPGIGYLTKELKSFNSDLTCFEIDLDTKKYLDKLVDDKTKVIYKDFMKVDLNEYYNKDDKIHVIANIPYYITTPIIEKIIDSNLNILDMTLMVQKEVADRLIATPGDKISGAITYSVYYYADSESIMLVDNNSFIPEPEVQSEVIKLKIRKEPAIELKDKDLFFKLIKISFMQRRKTLMNSLVNGGVFKNKEQARAVFEEIGLDMNVRGENLSMQDFKNLCDKIG